MRSTRSDSVGKGGLSPQSAPRGRRRQTAAACRPNAQARAAWSSQRDTPRLEAGFHGPSRRAVPSAQYAAVAEDACNPAHPAALAVLDPAAGEVQWLEFELAVAAYGLVGGFVDLDAARALLGSDGARRLVARAEAICARRGVGLLVETRQDNGHGD